MRSTVMWQGVERQRLRQRSRQMERSQPGQRPDPSLPAGTDRIPQIKHIVVLMMENHSFDNYLGTLGRTRRGLAGGCRRPSRRRESRCLRQPGARAPPDVDRAAARRALPELACRARAVGRRQDERLRDREPAGGTARRQDGRDGLLDRRRICRSTTAWLARFRSPITGSAHASARPSRTGGSCLPEQRTGWSMTCRLTSSITRRPAPSWTC